MALYSTVYGLWVALWWLWVALDRVARIPAMIGTEFYVLHSSVRGEDLVEPIQFDGLLTKLLYLRRRLAERHADLLHRDGSASIC